MAQVHFTSWLREFVPNGPRAAQGQTVAEVLTNLLSGEPQLRGYVLDDQGHLRKHVCIFADGTRLRNDAALAHRLRPESKLYVMQALSGG